MRIQLSRRRGSRRPPGTVSVARPTRWGNPFPWHEGLEFGPEKWAKGAAVDLYREWLFYPDRFPHKPKPPRVEEIVASLRGKNLGCWCKPGDPCHADALLSIANS